jgi:hypothetical protein
VDPWVRSVLNQCTHSRVAASTWSRPVPGPPGLMSSVLDSPICDSLVDLPGEVALETSDDDRLPPRNQVSGHAGVTQFVQQSPLWRAVFARLWQTHAGDAMIALHA